MEVQTKDAPRLQTSLPPLCSARFLHWIVELQLFGVGFALASLLMSLLTETHLALHLSPAWVFSSLTLLCAFTLFVVVAPFSWISEQFLMQPLTISYLPLIFAIEFFNTAWVTWCLSCTVFLQVSCFFWINSFHQFSEFVWLLRPVSCTLMLSELPLSRIKCCNFIISHINYFLPLPFR